MRSRLGTISLLVFQAVWLNVILPGHTRGVIRLPGSAPVASSCHTAAPGGGDPSTCCHKAVDGRGGDSEPDRPAKEGDDSGDPASHCAVCFFAARLTPPPAVDLTPPPLELLAVRAAPRPPAPVSAEFLPTYYGRGPPLV